MIILDVESKKLSDKPPSAMKDFDFLHCGISVCSYYDTDINYVGVVMDDNREKLEEAVAKTDYVVTFAGRNFDLPMIEYNWNIKIPTAKHYDIQEKVWSSLGLPSVYGPTHRGLSLDAISVATIGRGKSGSGADAPQLFKEMKYGQLIAYNIDDVYLTKDLLFFSMQNGFVIDPRTKNAIKMPLPYAEQMNLVGGVAL